MLYKVMSIPQHKCGTHKEYHKDQQAARSSQIVGRMQHAWPRTGCPWPCHYAIFLSRNHAAPSLRLLHTPHSPLRQNTIKISKTNRKNNPLEKQRQIQPNPSDPVPTFNAPEHTTPTQAWVSVQNTWEHGNRQAGALGNGDGASGSTSTAIAKVATRSVCVQGTWVKVRTRAWRRNLPNLIRNGHEPADYVREGSSSSSLYGVKISLWARYLAYTHPFSSLRGVQLELHSAQGEVAQRHRVQGATYAAEWAISRQFFWVIDFWGKETLGHWKCDTYVRNLFCNRMVN
jgi:hypothetical protein